MPCYVIMYYAMLCYGIRYRTILYCIVLYCIVLYYGGGVGSSHRTAFCDHFGTLLWLWDTFIMVCGLVWRKSEQIVTLARVYHGFLTLSNGLVLSVGTVSCLWAKMGNYDIGVWFPSFFCFFSYIMMTLFKSDFAFFFVASMSFLSFTEKSHIMVFSSSNLLTYYL